MQRNERDSDFTRRRRWVPLRGMEGSPRPATREAALRHSDDGVLDWLIIGGGIHGTYLSHFLIRALGVDRRRLRVLDPHERPLGAWLRNAENVGMEYLRSAAVHHLDLPSLSLKRFAAEQGYDKPSSGKPPFLPPYGRPLLELFNAHSEEIIRRNGLDRLRLRGRASGLRAAPYGYDVDYRSEAGEETIAARNVLLAIGMDDRTSWPEWARNLSASGRRVRHVLDPDFDRRALAPWSRAVVYGGGLSGEQISAALSRRSPGSVTLVSGHEIGVYLFDSEPSWQGENFMSSFAAERDPAERRAIIARARHRGSVTPEGQAELERLCDEGLLGMVTGEPAEISAEPLPNGRFRIDAGGRRLEGDLLILATGYDTERPGGDWLDRAVEELELPCAPCSYPLVAPNLEWRKGLFVSGPLAELELGPVARNISGAHRAAARLEYYLSTAAHSEADQGSQE